MKIIAILLLFGSVAFAQCAPGSYCAYSGGDIRLHPAGANMGVQFKTNARFYDHSLPSGILSPVIRCTDQSTGIAGTGLGKQSASAGVGGSGAFEQLFNVDSTMLHVNDFGGDGLIVLFDPKKMVCSNQALTANLNLTNPGSSSTIVNFGSAGTFDWTDTGAGTGNSIYYGVPGPTKTAWNKYVINKTTGQFTTTIPYFDLIYGLPVISANVSPWQANHAYNFGDYVSFTFTGLPDWNGTTAWLAGDIIVPATNNFYNCAFKVGVVGTRGTQPTTWSASTDGGCSGNQTKTEGGGTEAWRNLGATIGGATFTFQLISASGTSGASTPTFAPTPTGAQTVHPDLLTQATDGPLTWENVGTMTGPAWESPAGVSKDSNRFCSAFSTNFYGHGVGSYNNDLGDQGTGNYVACYDFSTNAFALLNTVSGIQSTTTCTGGTGYSCTGGTLKFVAQGTAALTAISANCSFSLHNAKGGSTLNYVILSTQVAPYAGTCPAGNENGLVWNPFLPWNQTTSLQWINTRLNHFATGDKTLINIFNAAVFGRTVGAYDEIFDLTNPRGTPTTSWQVGTPYTSTCDTAWFAGDSHPPCDGTVYDGHPAMWHAPGNDESGPACTVAFGMVFAGPPPPDPFQDEIVCINTSTTWDPSVGPLNVNAVQRFTHCFQTYTNNFFDDQFCIGQLSQDGKFYAFSTDWDCTLGDTAGNATNTCGYPWRPTTLYTVGQFVNPFSSLGGTGTNYGVYQVTTGGTSPSSAPAWVVCNSGNVGTTVTDSAGVVYTCVGSGNARGDVFIVNLSPDVVNPSRVVRAVQ